MEIYVKFLCFPYFSVFNHDFVIYIDSTHATASNTATDDVTNRSHIKYSIQTQQHFCALIYSTLMRNVAALTVFITNH